MTDFIQPAMPIRSDRFVVSVSSLYVALAALLIYTGNGGLFRFGSATGLVWTAATALLAIWTLRAPMAMSRLVAAHWPILALPGFAILSTAWSAAPAASLVDGVQMLFTMLISLHVAQRLSTRQIMLALAVSMGTGTALSVLNLALGVLPPVWEVNGALLGIFTQKNILAKAVFWTAFAFGALAVMRERPSGVLASMALAAALFPLTVLAMSVTGQMGFAFVALLYVLVGLRRLPAVMRVLLPALLMVFVLAVSVIYAATGGHLLGDTLALVGKGPTMTGRTVLWALGYMAWTESPLVGLGFNAYWTAPQYANAVTFISANVDDGLHGFHNTYVETFVGLGMIGGLWFTGLVLHLLARLLRIFLRVGTVEAAVWLAAAGTIAAMGMIEDSFSKPRSGHLFLFVMAYAWSLRTGAKSRRG